MSDEIFIFYCLVNTGSHEQSPHLADSAFHYECQTESDAVPGPDSQLREDLADAMKDDPSVTGKHFSTLSLYLLFIIGV